MDERRTRARADTAAVPSAAPGRPPVDLDRFVPSTRSILAGVALVIGGVAAFVLARHTSLFAVRTIEVRGAPPVLERQVRAALAPLVGESLARLDAAAIQARLAPLREIRGLSYDRAFPNTLKVFVRPDPPVAVLRSGRRAWFASADGAVVRPLRRPFPRRWPRVWLPRAAAPTPGADPLPAGAALALRALGDARRARSGLRSAVRTVRAHDGEITFVLRSGLELRLGGPRGVPLKLAVAARLLRTLTNDERERLAYVDLSVPSRPVAGTQP